MFFFLVIENFKIHVCYVTSLATFIFGLLDFISNKYLEAMTYYHMS